jgi:hypothetical protein
MFYHFEDRFFALFSYPVIKEIEKAKDFQQF